MKKAIYIALCLLISVASFAQKTDHFSKKVKAKKVNTKSDPMTRKVKKTKRKRQPDHMTKEMRRGRDKGLADHLNDEVRGGRRNNTTDHFTKKVKKGKKDGLADHFTKETQEKERNNSTDHFTKKVKNDKRPSGSDAFARKAGKGKAAPNMQISKSNMGKMKKNKTRDKKAFEKKKSKGQGFFARITRTKKSKDPKHQKAQTSVRNSDEYHQQNHFVKGKQQSAEVGSGWQKRKLFTRKKQRIPKQKQKKEKKGDDAFAYSPQKAERKAKKSQRKTDLDLFPGGVNPAGKRKGGRGKLK